MMATNNNKKRKASTELERETSENIEDAQSTVVDDVNSVAADSKVVDTNEKSIKNNNRFDDHDQTTSKDKEALHETESSSESKSAPQPKRKSEFENIRHVIITNDGNRENLVRLVGLKNLFAKQLPKMPKDYIVRLVFDRRHKSLAILSDDPAVKGTDDEIIGGICYRPYEDMRFSEIAFCAVNGNQQVKVRNVTF